MPRLLRSAAISLAVSLMDERPVDFANQIDFLGRAECQDHAVGLETLVLAAFKTPLIAPCSSMSVRRSPKPAGPP
jgi:hypothetical protein